MNILNKLTVKHLLMNKKRTLVTIIGIILSTSLMVGIGMIFSSFFDYSVREIESTTGKYHVKLYNIESKDSKYIKNNHQIESYTFFQALGYSYLKDGKNEYKPYLYLLGVDDSYYKDLTLTSGRFPKNNNEILLSDHILINGKVKYNLGDEIKLELGYRVNETEEIPLTSLTTTYEKSERLQTFTTKTYTVVGFVERSTFEPYSFPGYTVYTKLDEKDLIKDKTLMTRILYKNPKGVYDKTNNIIKNTCNDNCKEFYNNNLLSMYGESKFHSVNSFYQKIMFVVLSLITIGCTIVIYNSFAISVMERKKQFGLFSSIGATKKQIRHTVIFEAIIVGTIGIVIGILAGIIGIDIVLKITNSKLPDMFNEEIRLAVYPIFIIIPVIYMIITILASAFIPAHRASKISPIEAIRLNDDIKVSKRKIKTNPLTRILFGIEGELALKNIKRNKKKYRITIISLIISIVLFVAFSTFLEYGTKSSSYYFENKNYDISITTSEENRETIKTALNNLSPEELFDYNNYMSYLKIDNIKNQMTKDFVKTYTSSAEDFSLYIEWLILDQNQYSDFLKKSNLNSEDFTGSKVKPIIINSITHHDYNNGKVNKMKVFNKNNIIKNVNIIDYCYPDGENQIEVNLLTDIDITISNYIPKIIEYDLNTIKLVINDKMYQTLKNNTEKEIKKYIKDFKFKNNADSHILAVTKNSTKVEKELTKELRKNNLIDGEDYWLSNISSDKEKEQNLLFVTKMFLYGFISLVTLIGVTSVLNTINTSMSLRAKEFAILRSIGITPKGFNKMIAYESIIYGLKALLYGLPISLIVIYIFHVVFADIVAFSDILIPYNAILISVVAVFVIVFFTMMYATRKIKKANIIDTIREENI